MLKLALEQLVKEEEARKEFYDQFKEQQHGNVKESKIMIEPYNHLKESLQLKTKQQPSFKPITNTEDSFQIDLESLKLEDHRVFLNSIIKSQNYSQARLSENLTVFQPKQKYTRKTSGSVLKTENSVESLNKVKRVHQKAINELWSSQPSIVRENVHNQ